MDSGYAALIGILALLAFLIIFFFLTRKQAASSNIGEHEAASMLRARTSEGEWNKDTGSTHDTTLSVDVETGMFIL